MPTLHKGAEQAVVIRIFDGVAFALIYVLGIGELGTGNNVYDALGDSLFVVYFFIEIIGQGIDLVLPQVSQGSQEASLVTVKGGVAHSGLSLVGIAGKATAKGCRRTCQHPGAAVTGLYIFSHKGGNGEMALAAILKQGDGGGFQLVYGMINGLLDGNYHIMAAEVFSQLGRQSFGSLRIVDTGHIYEQDIVGTKDFCIEGGCHGGVDAAGNADDYLLHVYVLEEMGDAVL